jgi:hypothetical protein
MPSDPPAAAFSFDSVLICGDPPAAAFSFDSVLVCGSCGVRQGIFCSRAVFQGAFSILLGCMLLKGQGDFVHFFFLAAVFAVRRAGHTVNARSVSWWHKWMNFCVSNTSLAARMLDETG